MLLCPMVFKEIENHKLSQRRNFQKRARAIARWLSERLEVDECEPVRCGVKLHFIIREPQINWEHFGLSKDNQDDHIVASVLDFKQNHNDEVKVATSDLGLRVKLRGHGLNYFSMPEALKLPDEPDSSELEIRKLKEKLATLESRQPDLKLYFSNGKQHSIFSIHEKIRSAKEINDKLEMVRINHPKLNFQETEEDQFTALARMAGLTISNSMYAERVERYNDRLDDYYESYRNYLSQCNKISEKRASFHIVELMLKNNGNAQGTNIDITIMFPQEINLFTIDILPEYPKPPKPPKEPDRRGDILGSGFNQYTPVADWLPSYFKQPSVLNWKGPRIINTEKSASFWLGDLKHHHSFNLPKFLIYSDDHQGFNNFSAEYELSYIESPELETGMLHFTFSPREQ